MNQEKFISSYIELLNSTLTEAIQKNLTILAQKNVIEQELNEIKSFNDTSNKTLKNNLDQKQKEIEELKSQLNDARRQKDLAAGETNELKKNIQHIDTFKSELLKSRNEIDRLNSLVQEKKLVIDTLNREIQTLSTPVIVNTSVQKKTEKSVKKNLLDKKETQDNLVKDAGSF